MDSLAISPPKLDSGTVGSHALMLLVVLFYKKNYQFGWQAYLAVELMVDQCLEDPMEDCNKKINIKLLLMRSGLPKMRT